MKSSQATQPQSSADAKAFWKGLRSLRDGLPPDQRDALDLILANAAKAAILAKAAVTATARGAATEQTSEAVALARTLAKFRDRLAPRERHAFDALMAAGATQGAVGGGGAGAMAMVIGILVISLAPPLLLAIAGGIDYCLDEVEGEAPDLTGIPPTPEEL